jgi:Zn-dependent metalloprotease
MNVSPINILRYSEKTFKGEPISSIDSDPVAREALENASEVMSHFQKEYGRSSFDNKGGVLNVIVGYSTLGNPVNNAFWRNNESAIYFGDGDGKRFSPLGGAKDVMAHEFMHGVISSEVELDYQGEQGAIHESFSDILATGLDNNTQIGEDIYTPGIKGDALRDLSDMNYRHVGQLPGPDHKYYNEPHLWSEPISHAAYVASKEIGLDKVRKVWYTALTDHMKDNSGFLGARQATLSAAKTLYGDKASAAVEQAWNSVGVTQEYKPREYVLV